MKIIGDKPTDIRTIYKTEEFDRFYATLDCRVKQKLKYTINIIQTIYVIPTKYVKHLENSDLYEMRVSAGTNEYRTILFAIDHDSLIQASKIVLLNGFVKKSTKDYNAQIKKAERILKDLEL